MNLVVGPYLRRQHTASTPKFSMYAALKRIDECLQLIKRTGMIGLTDSTATLGLNLTHLMGSNVVVTNDQRSFNIIVQDREETFTLTGCIIQDTFHNIMNPLEPGYLISLNRQLIANSDDLIETIYNRL
ncbi:hypothetical protein D1831_07620 [Lactiplantibacillus garii]|uniref:Uncharacterized protein n=1 Tax=Lactiplantibacillus garii TaxID=2306423 RepID=A0A3R8J6V7_9LACO|nr:hypothetical protein [Lactiplantibacillus garii]RRK10418.1 hypothetical protein D1831_07620 [Lactiplantibacillus garii]